MTACMRRCGRDAMVGGVFCPACSSWVAWTSTGRSDIPAPPIGGTIVAKPVAVTPEVLPKPAATPKKRTPTQPSAPAPKKPEPAPPRIEPITASLFGDGTDA